MNGPIETVVIVGGGTAGWMSAAFLSNYLKHTKVSVILVESPSVPTVGVGEATIPTIRRFYGELGLTDSEVIKATNATCKLGIKFRDWHKMGEEYFHPFGLFGQTLNNVGFHHFWRKLDAAGEAAEIDRFSLPISMAKNNKFYLPNPSPKSPLSVFDWALHFDAALFAKLMKGYALKRGVRHLQADVDRVSCDVETGNIDTLTLGDGTQLKADLFLDCSGFSKLLIDNALGAPFESWAQWLKCDSAVVAQTERQAGDLPPYTISTAKHSGWQWKIPLQSRTGNGLVYSSEFLSHEAAEEDFVAGLDNPLITDIRRLRFEPGYCREPWYKNCVAIGLSSGFLEPLESTSIALIENSLSRLKMLFPLTENYSSNREEYNEMSRLEFESSRDFIILHYWLNRRKDTDFWRFCSEMEVPDRLRHRLEMFRHRGHFVKYRWEIFQQPSWLAIYSGNGVKSLSYDPFVEAFSDAYLKKAFHEMTLSIDSAVSSAPLHEDFLRENNLWAV